jgi:Icc-related predicted phosphoesterase
LVGDSHGDFEFIVRALRVARREGCDALVQLGDFGLWPDGPRRKKHGEIVLNDRWLDTVATSAKQHGVPIRFLDGNHDAHPLARAAYDKHPGTHIRPIRNGWLDWADRGATWTWCGVRFGALGGAFSIDGAHRTPGIDIWDTETTTDADVELLTNRGQLDVLLTHDAPYGVHVPTRQKLRPILQELSDENRLRISRALESTRPSLNVHGHFHSDHQSMVDHGDGTHTRVIGLASNLEAAVRARGILELPALDFRPT